MQDKKEINAFVNTWGLKEIEIGGVPQLVASIRFNDKDGNSFFFEGFLMKKDGTPNKNTINAIRACGFRSNDFSDFVKPNTLEKNKEVALTIEKNAKGYDEVKFVNSLGSFKSIMSSGEAEGKLTGFRGLGAINGALNSTPAVDEEEILF
jgi:hypothetical protein